MRFFIILIIVLIMILASNQNFLADDKIEKEGSMAIVFDPQQGVPLEELLTSLVVQQEASIRLLVKKGIFSREEFSEMVRVVNKELKPMGMKLPTPVEGR